MDYANNAIFTIFLSCGALSTTSLGGAYWFTCEAYEQVKLMDEEFEIVKHSSVIQVFVILTFLFSWIGFGVACAGFLGMTKQLYYVCFGNAIMLLLFSCTSFSMFTSSKNDEEYRINIANCSSGPGFSLIVTVFAQAILLVGISLYKANNTP